MNSLSDRELKLEIGLLRRRLQEANAARTTLEKQVASLHETEKEARILRDEYNARVLRESTDSFIGRCTADGVYMTVSPGSETLLGYRPDELIGRSVYELIHPQDIKGMKASHSQVLWQRHCDPVEHRLRRKDGSFIWVETVPQVLRDPETDAVNEVLWSSRDITKRRHAEDAIHAILEGTSMVSGDEFFKQLVMHLSKALGVKFVLVGELEPIERKVINTVAVWNGDGIGDNFTYDLLGTPCGNLMTRGYCCYPSDVQRLFPTDDLLKEMKVESYTGIPLHDSSGLPIGLLSILDVSPMGTTSLAEKLLKIFSIRASMELLRKRMEDALRSSEENYRQLFDKSISAFALHDIIVDENGVPVDYRYIAVNPAFEMATGLTAEHLIGHTIREVVPNIEQYWIDLFGKVALEGKPASWENRSEALGRWFEGTAFSPQPSQFAVTFNDITPRKMAEKEILLGRERLDVAVAGSDAGLWDVFLPSGSVHIETDEGYFSPKMKSFIGFAADEFPNSVSAWFSRVPPEDLGIVQEAIEQHLSGRAGILQFEHRIQHRDGSMRWLSVTGKAAPAPVSSNSVRVAGMCWDITFSRKLEEQSRHNALHDQLTGLPNRSLFLDRLEHAIDTAERSAKHSVAVLSVDLDKFKKINESFGQFAGDSLLGEVAVRLVAETSKADTVAHLGGDEFMILLEEVTHKSQAEELAKRLIVTLGQPFDIQGHEVVINASVGIALAKKGKADARDLLRDADTAMYRAKTLGNGRYVIFHPGMRDAVMNRVTLEDELRRALRMGEFVLHYQPICEIETGEFVGFECLSRWQHPSRGILHPALYLPIMEQTELILAHEEWALRSVCLQLQTWEKLLGRGTRMHVNLCPRIFSEDHVSQMINAVAVERSTLKSIIYLEITERMMMEHGPTTQAAIQKLKAAGFRLAIDDFGTGYSSLSYLAKLPVQSLKIDRSFVEHLTTDQQSVEIVSAIAALSKALNLELIAEGAETAAEVEKLAKMDVKLIQGYYFSHPLSAEDATQLLMKSKTD